MAIKTITLGAKSYDMQDTLVVREYKQIMGCLKIATEIGEAIKNGKPEDAVKMTAELNRVTVQDWESLENSVKRCYGLDDNAVGELHYADIMLLFSELLMESRSPKKNLPTQSSSA